MKTSKSRIDSMFGFELLWKIVILDILQYLRIVFEIKEHGKQRRGKKQRLLAKHRIMTKMIPDFVLPQFLSNQ